jgi:nitrogen fixation protein FixH
MAATKIKFLRIKTFDGIMNPENNPAHNPEKLSAWKSPWFWTIIGLVGIVLGANILMAFFALTSNPGLVTKDYFERGKSFANRTKPEFIRQNKLGWELELDTPGKIITGKSTLFNLTAKEKKGATSLLGSATLFAYRPSDATRDFSLPMTHEGNGVYSVKITFPLKGAWDIIAEMQKGETRNNLAKRVMVEEPWGHR